MPIILANTDKETLLFTYMGYIHKYFRYVTYMIFIQVRNMK